MRSAKFAAALVALITVAVLAVSACSFNTTPKSTAGEKPLADGETLGKIDRLPGGTVVATSVITLLDVSCANGRLLVKTNLKTIAGEMDCSQQIPQATVERFFGQSVSISYKGGRLRIDSVSAGTVDLPVKAATVMDVNATP